MLQQCDLHDHSAADTDQQMSGQADADALPENIADQMNDSMQAESDTAAQEHKTTHRRKRKVAINGPPRGAIPLLSAGRGRGRGRHRVRLD